VPGLGARLGRGGATTTQQDLANSDCVIIMGANMAENHPVGFRFVLRAKERGGTIIHIDPRFTRTSALADLHVPLRAGSDLAFLGALVNHVVNSARWHADPFFREYVVHYTNAATIIDPAFRDTEDLAGLFSGFDREQVVEGWDVGRALDRRVAAQGQDAAARPPDVAEQELQDRAAADDLGAGGVLRPGHRVGERRRPVAPGIVH
jgi:formate dehydrogenase major subunit